MPATHDPLTAFLASHRRSLPASRGDKRFNAGEHAWLAGRGAERACAELKRKRGLVVDPALFTSIRREHGRDELHYGEIVALSGDFYETPEDLFEERPALLPWLWESNDLSDLRQIFDHELKWIDQRLAGTAGPSYPDESLRMAWNAKGYVELALRNTAHFGWHNILAYCRHHAEALRLAAASQGRPGEQLRRALYVNAFADHFLTDGFAAGHVRVPRAEIIAWAAANELNDKVAGALSKLLHDQDGHINLDSLHGSASENTRAAEDGLRVCDSTGESWYTRCDGQLFLPNDAHSPAVERPILAVSASVVELLLAWKRQELPTGIYQATRYVPFPDKRGPTLVEKFPAELSDEALERLWQGVGWYAKIPWIAGLEKQHIRALFQALPDIMQSFRASVAENVRAEPELIARIDPGYVTGYHDVA